jgi:hypothetical protein
MTILDPSSRPGHDGRDVAKPDPRAGTLTLPSRPGTIRRRAEGHAGSQCRRAKAPARHPAHPIAGSHTAENAAKSLRRPVAGNDHGVGA